MRTPATSAAPARRGRTRLGPARTSASRAARAPWSPALAAGGRGLAPAGRSRTISRAGLSSRSPFQAGWRRRPSGVHSVNSTSPTSSGRTQCARAAPGGRCANGDVGRRERVETAAQVRRSPAGEAGADLADVDQLAVGIVHAEEQRADAAAPALRVGEAADDELLLLDALGLLPAAPATGHVGRVAPLRDDALERHAARVTEERLAVARDVIAVAQRRVRAVASSSARSASLRSSSGAAGEVAAVEVQEIEDEVDRLVAALAAERVLEGVEAGDAARQHARPPRRRASPSRTASRAAARATPGRRAVQSLPLRLSSCAVPRSIRHSTR